MEELKKIRLSMYGIFGMFFLTLSISMYVDMMIELDGWRFIYGITYIEPSVAVSYVMMSVVGLVLLALMVSEFENVNYRIFGSVGIGLLILLIGYILINYSKNFV